MEIKLKCTLKQNPERIDIPMFKIVEVAEKLGKSKTTIYNKLNENQAMFKPHLKKVEGVKMIDEQGYNKLLELLGLKEDEIAIEKDAETPNSINNSNDLIEVKNEIISELKDRIRYLELQAERKDELIENQSQQLGNFQILLKQEQDKLLYLEGNTNPKKRKGLFQKMFKKSME